MEMQSLPGLRGNGDAEPALKAATVQSEGRATDQRQQQRCLSGCFSGQCGEQLHEEKPENPDQIFK